MTYVVQNNYKWLMELTINHSQFNIKKMCFFLTKKIMKYYLSLLLSFFFLSTFGQTKILFDATKAETASNADWIIDADNFNLGYNPNAYVGGREANAQRVPTPAQSEINSTTTQNFWKGALSAWAVDAVKQGYYVETLPYDGKISYNDTSNPQDLSNYKVFVVCEPNILFTADEKTALVNFVKNGGGLFMISDHHNSDRNGDGYDSPDVWNDFMQNNTIEKNPFGITFNSNYFSDATTNMANLPNDPLLHGTYGDVSRVEFYGGTSMTLDNTQNATVTPVVYRSNASNTGTNNVLCAHANYGSGKVAALGDSSPADDGSGDTNDNLYDGWLRDASGNHERLIMNATIWLVEGSTSAIKTNPQSLNIGISTKDNICSFRILNSTAKSEYSIVIYTISGQKIIQKRHLSANQNIEIALPETGLYLYQIFYQNTVLKTGKVMIK